eukprot:gene12270-biopygen1901
MASRLWDKGIFILAPRKAVTESAQTCAEIRVTANHVLRINIGVDRDRRWKARLLPAPTSIICTSGVHTNCGNFEEWPNDYLVRKNLTPPKSEKNGPPPAAAALWPQESALCVQPLRHNRLQVARRTSRTKPIGPLHAVVSAGSRASKSVNFHAVWPVVAARWWCDEEIFGTWFCRLKCQAPTPARERSIVS